MKGKESIRVRNENIHNERLVEKKTLRVIAEKYGISCERVRQIVRRLENERKRKKVYPEFPELISEIEWNIKTYNCLYNDNLTSMRISDFVEYTKHNDIRRIPNLGRITAGEIQSKISNLGYDIKHIYEKGGRNG